MDEQSVNILFVLVCGAVAVHALTRPKPENAPELVDVVRKLFGCIALLFGLLVLFRDILGVV